MPVEDSDQSLAVRAGEGDRRAFDQLVGIHKGPLFRLARNYVGSQEDAYDLVQDAFISAWLAIRRYDPDRDFSAWLRTITLNKCRDFARRQSVRRKVLRLFAWEQATQSPHYNHPDGAEADDLVGGRLAALQAAIAELPAFYKEPLLLTAVSGLSHQAAAVQLKTTAKAIEMRIRRGKQRLAKALGNPSPEG